MYIHISNYDAYMKKVWNPRDTGSWENSAVREREKKEKKEKKKKKRKNEKKMRKKRKKRERKRK